ncbi:membrane protein FAM159A-like isoform X2 [Acanthaster planci]|uniref:Membrane protein FAM159A-like isoform X2 n=1 Tax=Acanthaster planci TaxID=133434 RepID=A0A8B7YG71_ACAPL|nr:membrane protein FAM159A-like isoform X2 [Acanthaster planci]
MTAFADYCQGYTDPLTGEFVTGFYCPGFSDDYQYYKCCGPSDSQYCCNIEDYNNYHGRFYWSVGKIIGVVIGGILGLVVLVVVIAMVVCCYARNFKRRQQTATTSGTHSMIRTRTTQRQRLDYSQQRQDYQQQSLGHSHQSQSISSREQAYESLGPSYPPPAYITLPHQSHPQPKQTPVGQDYYRYGQAHPAPSYVDFSQQALEFSSPQPDYNSHKPDAANTFAPEAAPPPPI